MLEPSGHRPAQGLQRTPAQPDELPNHPYPSPSCARSRVLAWRSSLVGSSAAVGCEGTPVRLGFFVALGADPVRRRSCVAGATARVKP